jgi:hypothetical protein
MLYFRRLLIDEGEFHLMPPGTHSIKLTPPTTSAAFLVDYFVAQIEIEFKYFLS